MTRWGLVFLYSKGPAFYEGSVVHCHAPALLQLCIAEAEPCGQKHHLNTLVIKKIINVQTNSIQKQVSGVEAQSCRGAECCSVGQPFQVHSTLCENFSDTCLCFTVY